jgi:hypothetical protein
MRHILIVALTLVGTPWVGSGVAMKPGIGGPSVADDYPPSCEVTLEDHDSSCNFHCDPSDPPFVNNYVWIYVESDAAPVWGELYGCGVTHYCLLAFDTHCYWQEWTTEGSLGPGTRVLRSGTYAICGGASA